LCPSTATKLNSFATATQSATANDDWIPISAATDDGHDTVPSTTEPTAASSRASKILLHVILP
jgi:hypothetical protein